MVSIINRDMKTEVLKYFTDNQKEIIDFKNQIIDKDIIIFLGNTRSGKSTLINYLIGTKLKAFEGNKKEYKIEKQEDNDSGPIIGQGSVSCTSLPKMYKAGGCNNEYIIDPPGFEDNRGIVLDIGNSLFINQIRAARTIKFVIVFDIMELLSDNIHHFTKTLEYIQALVSNFDELNRSFSFIFTKENVNYTQDEIVQALYSKVLNTEGLHFNKALVRNVIADKRFIGLFRMPTKGGVISNAIDVNVKNAIKYTHFVDINKCIIKFTISDKASETLLQIYPEYSDSSYFHNEIARVTQGQSNYFEIDKYVYASNDNELETTLEILCNIERTIKKELEGKFTTLRSIQKSLDNILLNLLKESSSCNFNSSFNFIITMDENMLMENKYRTSIIQNYKTSLNNQLDSVCSLIKKIHDEKNVRKSLQLTFNHAALSTGVGGLFTGIGMHRVFTSTAFSTAALGWCAAVAGSLATGVSLGKMYANHEEYSRRKEARRAQKRD